MSSQRRALITGGSGGIGAALCRRLPRAGPFVYVHSHPAPEGAAGLVRDIQAAGGQAALVSFDVTDGAATRVALEEILEAGPIQILVNNAGVHDDAVLPGLSAAQWHRGIEGSGNGF